MSEETPEIDVRELENWMMRYCHGKMIEGWDEEMECRYYDPKKPRVCRLYTMLSEDPDETADDYCPLADFVHWLFNRKREEMGTPEIKSRWKDKLNDEELNSNR